jgi:hypothetical protein
MIWCRRPNGFSDYPKWRAVSARAGFALCTVLAFVNRLEEFGNDAVNRGEVRGSISSFAAEDFAAALDISSDDAEKLLEALERPEIGWVADGMIADFHSRNPDTEDPTATERQRRKRSRERISRLLVATAKPEWFRATNVQISKNSWRDWINRSLWTCRFGCIRNRSERMSRVTHGGHGVTA